MSCTSTASPAMTPPAAASAARMQSLHIISKGKILSERLQRTDPRGNLGARGDEVRDDALVDVEVAFVFAEVAYLMAFGEYAPDFRAQFQRVRKHLEHDVTIPCAEAAIAKRGETQGVRRVIDEIEAPFERVLPVGCVLESCEPGPLETLELPGIRRLGRKRFPRTGKPLKRRGHARFRSPRPWAAPERAS